jgi:pimeloyl-ACP methyl ester carboxylesterase
MTVNAAGLPRPVRHGRVIALHCSGAGASQWCHLAETLGDRYQVAAPEHYGCESSGPWTGDRAFTVADEAQRAIALVDQGEEKVHLVGHSYGGGVALNVALSRPQRLASMTLYEPTPFHLLRQMGAPCAAAFAEIAGVAERICKGVTTGDYRGAVASFVDYWNGAGAWDAMRPSLQDALVRWAPKGPLDFHALINDPTPAEAYRAIRCPVLLLRGEHGPQPARLIAEGLADLLPQSRLAVVAGAGHMGPLTHAPQVSALVVQHIGAVEGRGRQPRPWFQTMLAGAARSARELHRSAPRAPDGGQGGQS